MVLHLYSTQHPPLSPCHALAARVRRDIQHMALCEFAPTTAAPACLRRARDSGGAPSPSVRLRRGSSLQAGSAGAHGDELFSDAHDLEAELAAVEALGLL